MQPRQIRDTSRPVRPSFTYSIADAPWRPDCPSPSLLKSGPDRTAVYKRESATVEGSQVGDLQPMGRSAGGRGGLHESGRMLVPCSTLPYLSHDTRCHANRFLACRMIGRSAEMATEERAEGASPGALRKIIHIDMD